MLLERIFKKFKLVLLLTEMYGLLERKKNAQKEIFTFNNVWEL